MINEREGKLFVVLPCFFACTVGERKVGNAKGLDDSLSFCFLYVYFHGCIIVSCRLMVTDFAFDTFLNGEFCFRS